MIASGLLTLLARSHRLALVICCGIASATLLGASKPETSVPLTKTVRAAAPVIQHGSVAEKTVAVDTNRELLQETSTAAIEPEVAALKNHEHHKTVWMTVTAYCSCTKCCGPKARGLTASGRSIAYNGGQFVAADTKLFKFGTQIQIPGYAGGQPVEVIDRGSAIKGYHIDLFFASHDQARQWGKRWMAVEVVE